MKVLLVLVYLFAHYTLGQPQGGNVCSDEADDKLNDDQITLVLTLTMADVERAMTLLTSLAANFAAFTGLIREFLVVVPDAQAPAFTALLCGGGGGGGGGALSPEECVLGAPRQGTAYLCASRADATKDNNYCFASWAYIDKDGADLKIVAHDFCRGRRLELVSLSLGASPTVKLRLHAHYTSSSEVSTNPAR